MARHAGLALPENLGQFTDRQFGPRRQGENPQARGLPRRPKGREQNAGFQTARFGDIRDFHHSASLNKIQNDINIYLCLFRKPPVVRCGSKSPLAPESLAPIVHLC